MVDLAELNMTCKSTIFKSVLNDLVYSFRMSIKKLTGAKTDIRLSKIRLEPISVNGLVVVGRIRSLVGGKISYAIDHKMINFLNAYTEFGSDITSEIFAVDLFDCFSSTSKHRWLDLSTDNIEVSTNWVDLSCYYIRFKTKIFTRDGEVIPSDLVISIDEIASMYFNL